MVEGFIVEQESHYILNTIYMPNSDYDRLKNDMENIDTFKILLPKIKSWLRENINNNQLANEVI